MTTATTPVTAGGSSGAPRLGALVRSEVLRARSRRSLRWLTIVALLGVAGVAAFMWFTSARVTAEDLSSAADQFRAESQQFYDACLADPSIPEADRAGVCWNAARAGHPRQRDLVPAEATRRRAEPRGTGAASPGASGCSSPSCWPRPAGGADWGARTMGLLLSWEPRRTRVFPSRLGVVIAHRRWRSRPPWSLLALGLGSLIAGAHDLVLPAGTSAAHHQPPDLGRRHRARPALAPAGRAGRRRVVRRGDAHPQHRVGDRRPHRVRGRRRVAHPGALAVGLPVAAPDQCGGVAHGRPDQARGPCGRRALRGVRRRGDGRRACSPATSSSRARAGLATLAVVVAVACPVSGISLRRRDVE